MIYLLHLLTGVLAVLAILLIGFAFFWLVTGRNAGPAQMVLVNPYCRKPDYAGFVLMSVTGLIFIAAISGGVVMFTLLGQAIGNLLFP